MEKKIDLSFDDLFDQALKDWSEYIDINKPIEVDTWGLQEKVARKYYGKKNEILFSTLHRRIIECLRLKEKSNCVLIKLKLEIRNNLHKSLLYYIEMFCENKELHRFNWNAQDVALAKAYLDANKDEEESE